MKVLAARIDFAAEDRAYDKALEKAREVPFTTRNNPLALTTPEEAYARDRISQNMEALRTDAHRRANPANGRIYAGIMDMRYGG